MFEANFDIVAVVVLAIIEIDLVVTDFAELVAESNNVVVVETVFVAAVGMVVVAVVDT
jgi:uncharacterized membrane protein